MNTNTLSAAEQNALSVSYEVNGEKIVLDLDFVKKYLVSGDADKVTNQELLFYMNTCKMQKLNPLVTGESYLIKYGDRPAQLVVGKAAYLKRAFKNPNYLYKKDGIVVLDKKGEIIKKPGCAVYPGEKLIAGWCEVYYRRNDREYSEYKEVSLEEFNQNMANWKTKPAMMINKVSVSQCIREAFPDDFEGIYADDEMIASGAIPVVDEKTGEIIDNAKDDPVITNEQRQILFKTAREHMGKEEANETLKHLLEIEGYEATTNLPTSVYKRVLDGLFNIIQQNREESAIDADFSDSEEGEEAEE